MDLSRVSVRDAGHSVTVPAFHRHPMTPDGSKEKLMAQDTSGAAGGTGTLVVRGEMAARIDRLPLSWMHWEIAFIVQAAWAAMLATDGPALRLYPFIWEPKHLITSSQYSVLYAFEVGIGILIGGYGMGWLGDKIGRRKALMIAAVLAGAFSWPFAYVTSYPWLLVLSVFTGLGCGGALAINVVYLSEMTSPATRGRVVMGGQVLAIILLEFVLIGWIPHFMVPAHYQAFQWLLTGVCIVLILPLLYFRMPESPRWLESRERFDEARKIVEKLEARVMKRHPVLPEPDLAPHTVVAEEKTSMFAVFSKQYVYRTVFMLVVFVLLYGGIVYGNSSYAYVFLSESRGFSAGSVFELQAWGGLIAAGFYALNALYGDRLERRTMVLVGAIIMAVGWFGMNAVHNNAAVIFFYFANLTGVVVFLWNMYAYVPLNFPTRMRGLGTGWTDGVGHLGAWGGVLLCGHIFLASAPLNWILLITIPGALVPGVMVGFFGIRQRRRALEELSQ
jgi:MFS family permease